MIIVKIGGGGTINLKGIAYGLAAFKEKFIIVHGANALRDEIAAKLNYEKKILTSASGYSSVYSNAEALDIMMMAYSGLRNKRLVELLQQAGVNAVGLSGVDGRLIQGRRNKGIRVREAGKTKIVRDFSGKPQSVNFELLDLLLQAGYTPVITMPIIDENGAAINSENDDVVAVLQSVIKAPKIISLIEAPGFLENADDESSLITHISKAELRQKETEVDGRMKRKVHALNTLLESGDSEVIISDGRNEDPIGDVFNKKGTVIK